MKKIYLLLIGIIILVIILYYKTESFLVIETNSIDEKKIIMINYLNQIFKQNRPYIEIINITPSDKYENKFIMNVDLNLYTDKNIVYKEDTINEIAKVNIENNTILIEDTILMLTYFIVVKMNNYQLYINKLNNMDKMYKINCDILIINLPQIMNKEKLNKLLIDNNLINNTKIIINGMGIDGKGEYLSGYTNKLIDDNEILNINNKLSKNDIIYYDDNPNYIINGKYKIIKISSIQKNNENELKNMNETENNIQLYIQKQL
jgi:hypothetical protein